MIDVLLCYFSVRTVPKIMLNTLKKDDFYNLFLFLIA